MRLLYKIRVTIALGLMLLAWKIYPTPLVDGEIERKPDAKTI